MVDNNEQWDEMEEYTEYDDSDTGEYDEEGYESGAEEEYDEQYYDEYEDDGISSGTKKSNPILGILIFLILLGALGYFAYTKFFAGKTGDVTQNTAPATTVSQENQQSGLQESQTEDMGDFFFSEAGGNQSEMMNVDFNETSSNQLEETSLANSKDESLNKLESQNQIVDEQPAVSPSRKSTTVDDMFGAGDFSSEQEENNAIMVAYDKDSRVNPFKPPVDKSGASFDSIDGIDVEIIEPPTESVEDPNLTKLLQTQISGILFDDESPSAIINLGGVDYFVKAGDTISVYTVNEISKNQVQITYKNNSYVASVGELFVRGKLESQPAIVNIENKFAGRYKNN